jgi:hypothetical protein
VAQGPLRASSAVTPRAPRRTIRKTPWHHVSARAQASTPARRVGRACRVAQGPLRASSAVTPRAPRRTIRKTPWHHVSARAVTSVADHPLFSCDRDRTDQGLLILEPTGRTAAREEGSHCGSLLLIVRGSSAPAEPWLLKPAVGPTPAHVEPNQGPHACGTGPGVSAPGDVPTSPLGGVILGDEPKL